MPHKLKPEEVHKKLIEIAKHDGLISKDEHSLIDAIKQNLDEYFHVLDEGYSDGVITPQEQHQFYEFRKQVMEEALNIAKSDEQITQDEFRLLTAIREILKDLEAHEHY